VIAAAEQIYAVQLVVRNMVVLWSHPVWWRFWSRVPRRMGYRTVRHVTAGSSTEAQARARERLEREVARRARNDPGDPWRVEVEGCTPVEHPDRGQEFPTWFSEEGS
jgi:hypothetical protein